jgi:hypothetical protein
MNATIATRPTTPPTTPPAIAPTLSRSSCSDCAAFELFAVTAPLVSCDHVVFKLKYGFANASFADRNAPARSLCEQPPLVHGLLEQQPQNGGWTSAHLKNRPALHC